MPAADFEALYRSSVDDVFAYAAALLRDRSAAEEVTAAAFERALRRSHTFDPSRGSPRAWLFGIVRNAALDELRRRRRIAELPGEVALDDEADESARRVTVRAALARLDARDRELVALRFHAGLDHNEIARVLGISPTNASTRLHRALSRLREACHVAS